MEASIPPLKRARLTAEVISSYPCWVLLKSAAEVWKPSAGITSKPLRSGWVGELCHFWLGPDSPPLLLGRSPPLGLSGGEGAPRSSLFSCCCPGTRGVCCSGVFCSGVCCGDGKGGGGSVVGGGGVGSLVWISLSTGLSARSADFFCAPVTGVCCSWSQATPAVVFCGSLPRWPVPPALDCPEKASQLACAACGQVSNGLAVFGASHGTVDGLAMYCTIGGALMTMPMCCVSLTSLPYVLDDQQGAMIFLIGLSTFVAVISTFSRTET